MNGRSQPELVPRVALVEAAYDPFHFVAPDAEAWDEVNAIAAPVSTSAGRLAGWPVEHGGAGERMIGIAVTSLYVDDQSKALAFYTEVLGFEKKQDTPLREARWLTVASPAGPEGVELLLEPNASPIARTYQAALFDAGIPTHTVFAADDIHAGFE